MIGLFGIPGHYELLIIAFVLLLIIGAAGIGVVVLLVAITKKPNNRSGVGTPATRRKIRRGS